MIRVQRLKTMSLPSPNLKIEARACPSAYLALTGIWLALSAGYCWLALRSENDSLKVGAIIALSVALVLGLWLHGFRLRVSNDRIEHRDGFYRCTVIETPQITDIKHSLVEYRFLGRTLRVPRLVVTWEDSSGLKHLIINTKPFQREVVRQIERVGALLRKDGAKSKPSSILYLDESHD